MKNIILILVIILTSCTQSTNNYGEIITKNNISNLPSVISELKNSGQIETTLSGKIISTCPKKGCWMRVETGFSTGNPLGALPQDVRRGRAILALADLFRLYMGDDDNTNHSQMVLHA